MKFSVLLPVAVLVSAVAAAPQPGITAAPVMRRQDDQGRFAYSFRKDSKEE
jgi:hypothetical protein